MFIKNTSFLAVVTSITLFGIWYSCAVLLSGPYGPTRRFNASSPIQGYSADGERPVCADSSAEGVSSSSATWREKKQSHLLLLSSVGRSGSTFLGELLSQRPGTVFMFEPELYLQQKTSAGVTAPASRDLIERMFSCEFSEEWSRWARLRKNIWEPGNHYVCNGYIGNDYHHCLKEICRKNVFRVIKTIKLRVWWTGEMLLRRGVKVVHLVRDPRASFLSLARLNMVQSDCKVWCPRIQQDLEMVSTMRSLFPASFISVKYEDLCRDPWGMAMKLWKFIGNENDSTLPMSWTNFLQLHTITTGKKPFSTERNTRQQIGAWREIISEHLLQEVERHCGDVIDMLGHTRFHVLANVRNFSIPLERSNA
ncbi:carbohydrate sulfotransferase 4-like [Penaeus japonicus]|uniref:carbohydrate sulfotransferase 4-like n=1 Tax=Penaeus japonicus TaxID=27405 RepID=UPI001C71180C|nr:carbohydrate sulfotransferase 4-like [Penaeus japonicus]XP_042884477.1 carbohydrate sulfotransferase 4-like [Penaeus japonicus]